MRFLSIIAPTMKNRAASAVIIISPILFILLNITHILAWKCPLKSYTGLPCGGCGMTRGIIAALKGNFKESLSLHPFASPLLLIWCGYTLVQFFPTQQRLTVIQKVESVEQRSGIVFIFIALYATFGIVRLLVELTTRH